MTARCPRPFDTILIDKNGSCYPCECVAWLPYSIGNIRKKPIKEILSSTDRQVVKDSINDGSFRYCNKSACAYLQVEDHKRKLFRNKPINDIIKFIRIAIDDSCNLYCPSCRNSRIFHTNKKLLQTKKQWCDQIIEYLDSVSHQIQVHIGSDGDPFASIIYRYLLTQAPNKKNISYTLQSNGLLLEKMFHRLKHIGSQIKEIHISCDGASKVTYEKLRAGGKWKHINQNLHFLSNMKYNYNFKTYLHVVVQRDNYNELDKFIEMAQRYAFDKIYFNKIQNWNTTLDFANADVFNHKHKNYQECQEAIKRLISNSSNFPKEFIDGTAIPY